MSRPGQIVFSKQGRDKGLAMIVVDVDGDYVFLVDGRFRLLAKPKRKKIKHVQITNHVISLAPACGRDLQDADIRKYLQAWNNVSDN